MVGLAKDKIEVDYLCYFDEYFFYPIKNIPCLDNPNLRKIGNKYDMRLLSNINIKVEIIIII